MPPQLSSGALLQINQGADPASMPITVQVLSVKKIPGAEGTGAADRWRLVISDGQSFMQSMLATQLNEFIADGQLAKNALLSINKYVANSINGKNILIILQLEVLGMVHGDHRIGNPVNVDTITDQAAPLQPPQYASNYQKSNQQAAPMKSASNAPHVPQAPHAPINTPIFHIKSLNPYQNKWTIKARVLNKSDIKNYSNQRGSGQLFSVILSDASGEIKATGFKDAVQLFYDLLQEGSVYQISKGSLRPANKQYNTTDNDYEMTFDQNTSIALCAADADVPKIKYNPLPIAQLGDMKPNENTDVLAIVKESSEMQELVSKSQKQLKKRELVVCDQSGYQVRLTLWGRQAESFPSHEDGLVIGIKGAKIGEFSGRSLSVGFDSSLQINPDIPEAHRLKGWWDQEGRSISFQSYTSSGSTGGPSSNPVKTIAAVTDENLGMDGTVAYFKLVATVSHIKQENCMYPACPTEGCAKKVTEMDKGWRCEKCDSFFSAPEYRYILSFCVSDFTGQMWLQSFNEQGTKLLGVSANELHNLKMMDPIRHDSIFSDALGQLIEFKVRAKAENYQDEMKLRCAAQDLNRADYSKMSLNLIELIDSWKTSLVM